MSCEEKKRPEKVYVSFYIKGKIDQVRIFETDSFDAAAVVIVLLKIILMELNCSRK